MVYINFAVAILPENMIVEKVKKKKLFVQKLPIKISRTCGIFRSKEELFRGTEEILMEITSELAI